MSARSRAARWAALIPLVILAIPASAQAGVAIVPSPNPGTTNTLGGLIAFAPADIWGVGAAACPRTPAATAAR